MTIAGLSLAFIATFITGVIVGMTLLVLIIRY